MASVQMATIPPELRVFSSWGNSPMGYSLPAAIGAFISDPSREVVCVIGDGGMQVNIQELQTIVHYQIPVRIVLWNNHGYVMIHEYQDGNLHGVYEAAADGFGYSHPNFAAVCQAYGIPYFRVGAQDDLNLLVELLEGMEGPGVIEVEVDPSARLLSAVSGNDPIHLVKGLSDVGA